ncbi:class I SAM-dependent methyltransferase [Streptomyces sp. NPDC052496]|uniref:class I SAM-dependent methyltransferase n=1 Tax=Streptomyces sp. NPDC052496 TaxID=3154951 RepID=UPI0034126676
MIDLLSGSGDAVAATPSARDVYDVRFDLGHHFRLFDRPGAFRVSPAGRALGNHLVHQLREDEITGRILEVGTGSGAIALLLRSMGATSITATDISAAAADTARRNELANFGDAKIDFRHADLFPGPGQDGRYDLIVFNPPGWRAPSDTLKGRLEGKRNFLDLEAMFYGDRVLLRFLRQLPDHLAEGGRAVIGLNSLLGIADLFDSCRSAHRQQGDVALHSKVLERTEFPLLFYTEEWREVRDCLLAQFEQGRRNYAATYTTKGDDIHWFYEITEVTVEALTKDLVKSVPGHE